MARCKVCACATETSVVRSLISRHAVVVWGAWIPRHIFGKLHVVMAILRMLWVALWLVLRSASNTKRHDVIVSDQVSFAVPLLRLTGAKVLFYVHFPDKLLATRQSWLKAAYRAPIDWLEEITTRAADLLVANSKFTASMVRTHFPSLAATQLEVLFPTTTLSRTPSSNGGDERSLLPAEIRGRGCAFLLSVNRYERKKNHPLAVEAFALVATEFPHSHLVIAGGYDDRVVENRQVFDELRQLVARRGLGARVTMLRSVNGAVKQQLLQECVAVVYTPRDEHFGIVPLEAMVVGRPVIASNSGGPTETVADGETGFLCDDKPDAFAGAMRKLLRDRSGSLVAKMGAAGVARVEAQFGFRAFTRQLNGLVTALAKRR